MTKHLLAPALVVVVAIAVSGCGGGGKEEPLWKMRISIA